ncbi:MAG: hypothetical protein IAE79_21720 [Anaerolinea sp.]|nr:hypothetical protein [Anaerolinea sp.]
MIQKDNALVNLVKRSVGLPVGGTSCCGATAVAETVKPSGNCCGGTAVTENGTANCCATETASALCCGASQETNAAGCCGS